MPKPKGTRDKATLEKQDRAPALLTECREERARLSAQLQPLEERVLAEQLQLKELKKQLRAVERQIEELERDVAEKEAREKKAADIARIQAAVGSLVDRGISAEEIIQRLQ